MTDTLWADISEFQIPVNDSYPHQILCIRSNDGNYLDHHFDQNKAWCDQAVASGKLAMYIVYYFFRPTGTGFSTLKSRIPKPSPHMAVMIDVESDGGRVVGNQSSTINGEFDAATTWLGSPSLVIGYGNTHDLDNLWPQKPPGIRFVIAAYGSNPPYPGRFAHQYTSSGACAPFGTCDMNSADGMSLTDVTDMFGINVPPPPPAVPPLHVDYFDVRHNSTCPDVRTWQAKMSQRGWRITIDGVYGSQSAGVCATFQQEKNLHVDGIVGPQTWQATWLAPVT